MLRQREGKINQAEFERAASQIVVDARREAAASSPKDTKAKVVTVNRGEVKESTE
jgi:hypothetical protein